MGGGCGSSRSILTVVAMADATYPASTDCLDPPSSLYVAPAGIGSQGRRIVGGVWHRGILAARAHDRRADDHDYRGHDAGSAWPHRTTARRSPIDHGRVCPAHGSRANAGVWTVGVRIELSRGDPMGGTLLDDRVRAIRRRLHANFVGASCGRQARLKN